LEKIKIIEVEDEGDKEIRDIIKENPECETIKNEENLHL
jgi:hypothetical protein